MDYGFLQRKSFALKSSLLSYILPFVLQFDFYKTVLFKFVELNYESSDAAYSHGEFQWSGTPQFDENQLLYRWNESIGPPGPTETIRSLEKPEDFVSKLLSTNIVTWLVMFFPLKSVLNS